MEQSLSLNETQSTKRFKDTKSRIIAAKKITQLVLGYELVGMCKDVARYVAEKPDASLFDHVGPSVELRRDLAELDYDQFLLNNDLLTPEAALTIYQKQFTPQQQIEKLN